MRLFLHPTKVAREAINYTGKATYHTSSPLLSPVIRQAQTTAEDGGFKWIWEWGN